MLPRRIIVSVSFKRALIILSCFAFVDATQASGDEVGGGTPSGLKQFLKSYLGDPVQSKFFGPTKIAVAALPSVGTAEDFVVYVKDGGWCGEDGGCTLLVLEQREHSFKVIGRTPNASLPVRSLETKTHGKVDIGVTWQGYGIRHPYEIRMRFNGNSYPDTLSGSRFAVRNGKGALGKIIISDKSAFEPLYESK